MVEEGNGEKGLFDLALFDLWGNFSFLGEDPMDIYIYIYIYAI